MGRKPKEYKNLSMKMDRELFEKLEKQCEEEDRTKTAVIERALKRYLDEAEENKEK